MFQILGQTNMEAWSLQSGDNLMMQNPVVINKLVDLLTAKLVTR